jgi:hypothetical protein
MQLKALINHIQVRKKLLHQMKSGSSQKAVHHHLRTIRKAMRMLPNPFMWSWSILEVEIVYLINEGELFTGSPSLEKMT